MHTSLEATVAALAARVEELGQTCERLQCENASLRADVAMAADLERGGPEWSEAPSVPAAATIDRRSLGKLLGAGAAAAVGGTLLAGLAAGPAAASDGNSVAAGEETTAEARTSVRYDGAGSFGGVVLLGNDSTYGGQTANYPAALGGWAGAGGTAGKGGVENGIYGFTDNGAGNGVVGYDSGAVAGSGAGVLGLAFGPHATGVEGHNTQGTAISGATDSTAAEATAILGTIDSTSPGGFSTAVRGVNNGTGGLGIGVWGSQAGSGWGVYATSEAGIGLNASGGTGAGVAAGGATGVVATGSEVGVVAQGPVALRATGPVAVEATGVVAVQAEASGATATAVAASATSSSPAVHAVNDGAGSGLRAESQQGRGGVFEGAAAQIKLIPGTGASHPAAGEAGDLYVDKQVRLWLCTKGGNHATWVRVA